MQLHQFKKQVYNIKSKQLGGLEAQLKLAPKLRLQFDSTKIADKNPREAAVLALFYPNIKNEMCFLLTERATYKGTHSAQISFPGGKIEPGDLHLKHTALRETFEEVGVLPSTVNILKKLTQTYIPPSNFLVTPFLGFTEKRPNFILNNEVANVIEVLLADLLDENTLTQINITTSYMKNENVPCFKINGYIVWGATAMMLSEIKELLKL